MKKSFVSRRQILKSSGSLLVASAFFPQILFATEKTNKVLPEKCLELYNIHTGESFKGPFWAEGNYIEESMKDLSKLLRDHRTNDTTPMCRDLFDLLHTLNTKLDTSKPVQIISGYRSPKTNEMLRRQGRGVARNSKHLTGHAVDIKIPGTKLCDIRTAALAEKAGGVGYYPKAGFVHVDIRGRPARW